MTFMPAIKKDINLYNPLKAYFLSLNKCHALIKNFLTDRTSEMWLKFIN